MEITLVKHADAYSRTQMLLYKVDSKVEFINIKAAQSRFLGLSKEASTLQKMFYDEEKGHELSMPKLGGGCQSKRCAKRTRRRLKRKRTAHRR